MHRIHFVKMSQSLYINAILCAVLLIVSSGERVGQGNTFTSDKDWSYQWYENEPFMLYCNTSELDVSDSDYILWEKPSLEDPAKHLFLQRDHDDDNYKIYPFSGVEGFQLHIKKITAETSGVYVCRVHDKTTGVARGQTILGINIRDKKYEELFDKYRSHFIVAIIATAVFVVPLATMCITYHFRYERTHHMGARYAQNGREMKPYPDGLADTVQAGEKGAYENPDFREDSPDPSTNL